MQSHRQGEAIPTECQAVISSEDKDVSLWRPHVDAESNAGLADGEEGMSHAYPERTANHSECGGKNA